MLFSNLSHNTETLSSERQRTVTAEKYVCCLGLCWILMSHQSMQEKSFRFFLSGWIAILCTRKYEIKEPSSQSVIVWSEQRLRYYTGYGSNQSTVTGMCHKNVRLIQIQENTWETQNLIKETLPQPSCSCAVSSHHLSKKTPLASLMTLKAQATSAEKRQPRAHKGGMGGRNEKRKTRQDSAWIGSL